MGMSDEEFGQRGWRGDKFGAQRGAMSEGGNGWWLRWFGVCGGLGAKLGCGDLFSGRSMDIRQQGTEGFQNESSNTVPQTIPQATTNEMNGLSPLSFLPMNEYEEIMALLTDDNDISQQDHTWIQPKTFLTSEEEDSVELLFQLDHSFSIEEILGEDQTLSSQTQVGGSSSHELRDFVEQSVTTDTTSTIPLDSNSSDRMNISISPGVVVSNVSTTTFGERSSNEPAQQLGDNMGVFNPIFSSENFSTSSLSMPENNPNVWPSGSDAFYPPRAGASFGDSTFPNTTGNSFTQFESPSFSVHPYGCASASFGTSASASDLVGDSVTQFPVFPYAGPVVGSGAAANNLDGNFPVHPYVGASASTSVGPIAGPSTTTFVGTGAGAKNLDGNSLIRHQSSGFPVHTYGSDSADAGGIASASGSASDARVFSGAADANASPYGSNEQFTRDHRFEMSRTNPLAAPSTMGANTCASPVPMMTRYNQTKSFPRQPVLMDIKDLVQSWEVD
ncbi:unnamed protein product [Sphenostylis stenocarpa]|uniref:Uncharacterized protein n=1 Tax=Sphenostylis stenocarpa TaxID=92480 RepID=A0AA86STE4_9FABA|nr:unnamed protein product [Sphenostylis stenocarpa]